ncbi:hypothetical protein QAD02_008293 [Eretmocerus hayati]|uniref:Uncharacterized protein n=1 Tax=Eretmocerus hayati TaxID=131215 RepID=A0ACC2N6W9_9HYME|nr:hypothetical protein QAD02_008293 [Eretmocerus hayati]
MPELLCELQLPQDIPKPPCEQCSSEVMLEEPLETCSTQIMVQVSSKRDEPIPDKSENLPDNLVQPMIESSTNLPSSQIIVKKAVKRGRPKKKDVFQSKKQKLDQFCKVFELKSRAEQARTLLRYIVSPDSGAKLSLRLQPLKREQIAFTTGIPCWLFCEGLDFTVLQPYMEQEAYQFLCSSLKPQRRAPKVTWICQECKMLLENDDSVRCDECIK